MKLIVPVITIWFLIYSALGVPLDTLGLGVYIPTVNSFQVESWIPSNTLSYLKSFIDDFYKPRDYPNSHLLIDGVKGKVKPADKSLENWLILQKKISFESILNNIGGVGINDDAVAIGAVIASPSKERPNYFYQWTRDAAITIGSLIEYLEDNEFNENNYNLVFAIESYIANSYKLQRLDNKSGSWESLAGLGEPKFMPDSSTFNLSWGRPQRDGPGLRAITIIRYLNLLEKYRLNITHPELHSSNWIYDKIVKPDLNYIIKYWYQKGFDLWEEVNSIHLFTSLTQLKALKLGIEISDKLDNDKVFKDHLFEAFCALKFYIVVDSGFKNSNLPYLIETPSLVAQGKRSGLDVASILASLISHDMTSQDSKDIPFPVEDSIVFSTLTSLINDMKYRYPINHGKIGFSKGFALGRYPEDIYDGYGLSEGNPWFISTATASELIYKIIYNLHKNEKDLILTSDQAILISEISNIHFKCNFKEIILPFGSDAFYEMTMALMNYADSFLEIIMEHVDNEGHMSEQFNRYSGYMEGAENLTWSYGSFWSSLRWREKALGLL